MAAFETKTRKITQRLLREGWVLKEGGNHSKFIHADHPGLLIVVPRYAGISPGVARSIAKDAGWI